MRSILCQSEIPFVLPCVQLLLFYWVLSLYTAPYVTAKTVITNNYVEGGKVLTSFSLFIAESITAKNYATRKVNRGLVFSFIFLNK